GGASPAIEPLEEVECLLRVRPPPATTDGHVHPIGDSTGRHPNWLSRISVEERVRQQRAHRAGDPGSIPDAHTFVGDGALERTTAMGLRTSCAATDKNSSISAPPVFCSTPYPSPAIAGRPRQLEPNGRASFGPG